MGILQTFRRAETADRTYLVGASAAPIILGLSPYKTPFTFWLEQRERAEAAERGEVAEVTQGPKARGRYLEAGLLQWTGAVCKAAEVEAGIPLDEPGIAGPEAWAQFHPDGALRLPDGAWRLAEIKTSRSAHEWGDDGSDEIPLAYQAQVQFQLACLPGIDECVVGAYLPIADRLRTFVVQSDPQLQATIFERCGEWVYRHIVQGEAPPIDGSRAAAQFLRDLAPKHLHGLRAADDYEANLVREFARIKAGAKALEAQADSIGNALRERIGEAEGLTLEGVGKVTWRQVKGASRLDAEALRRDHADLAAQYTVRGDDRRDLRFWPAKG
jgi:predicted phage-related endonuclease